MQHDATEKGKSTLDVSEELLLEEEEEGFYKILPANTADHLCQSWQSCSNHHESCRYQASCIHVSTRLVIAMTHRSPLQHAISRKDGWLQISAASFPQTRQRSVQRVDGLLIAHIRRSETCF